MESKDAYWKPFHIFREETWKGFQYSIHEFLQATDFILQLLQQSSLIMTKKWITILASTRITRNCTFISFGLWRFILGSTTVQLLDAFIWWNPRILHWRLFHKSFPGDVKRFPGRHFWISTGFILQIIKYKIIPK